MGRARSPSAPYPVLHPGGLGEVALPDTEQGLVRSQQCRE
jgi:hypothetical protein